MINLEDKSSHISINSLGLNFSLDFFFFFFFEIFLKPVYRTMNREIFLIHVCPNYYKMHLSIKSTFLHMFPSSSSRFLSSPLSRAKLMINHFFSKKFSPSRRRSKQTKNKPLSIPVNSVS